MGGGDKRALALPLRVVGGKRYKAGRKRPVFRDCFISYPPALQT
jgi:hypothetical protein